MVRLISGPSTVLYLLARVMEGVMTYKVKNHFRSKDIEHEFLKW